VNLSRAASVARLYEQRVYRNLPCFQGAPRDDVFALACFLVTETERGRGVARALLSTAITEARAAGASALEAFPRAAPEDAQKLRPDEIWLGPEGLLKSAGFTPVSDFRPYPVLRLALR
jgi:GNAT superfamily N-acetyltransferase